MSTSTLVCEQRRGTFAGRCADYLELTKPRISVMVLVTVGIGALAASGGRIGFVLLLHTLAGTALIAASASTWNQWIERGTDRLMNRTADRPIATGRLSPVEIVLFGTLTLFAGLAQLALSVNWTTAILGLATWLMYVVIYTPLKSRTSFNTVMGAVAGALPVLMGWAAVGQPLTLTAWSLFTIVYLWQFPHFMAIAWIYRRQYEAAGLRMLTVVDPTGRRAGVQAVMSALTLLPISLLPCLVNFRVGSSLPMIYAFGAVLLGMMYLASSLEFMRHQNEGSARRLLRVSLVHLPALLTLLLATSLP